MDGEPTDRLIAYCRSIDKEIDSFYAGENNRSYEFLGAHFLKKEEQWFFALWAPNAKSVRLVGSFNEWNVETEPMTRYKGLWVSLLSAPKQGDLYKYYIEDAAGNFKYKADPYAFASEPPPGNASKLWDIAEYNWTDGHFLKNRDESNVLGTPLSIYEVHLGSWRKKEDEEYPNYREIADSLSAYVKEMGFTHIEIMPVNGYPFDGSWGYQVTGFFSITYRFGTPQDFMYFVDKMHEAGIGVIADWVPAHFPKDAFGLAQFDGTWLYEHKNPIRREHPQWGTYIFNYNRPEVCSFLISSAELLLEKYHLDGIRVDAVSSMLYLDYGRTGAYIPNDEGGNIDQSAVGFIQKLNKSILTEHPGAITVAEESTAFPLVTKPTYDGGLGFLFKWNMGFMHDTLDYMRIDPVLRKGNHDKMTFSMFYAFSENFILAYSHDEVVHGKASMIDKMFGRYPEKFEALKALYAFMYAHPGKKLLFMGDEFGQFVEWNYKKELEWFLLDYESHRGLKEYVRELNFAYRDHEAFYSVDDGWDGFTWLVVNDRDHSVFAFLRSGKQERVLCIFNFTPVAREDYLVPLPNVGKLKLFLNSCKEPEEGKSKFPAEVPSVEEVESQGFSWSTSLYVPPLSAQYYLFTDDDGREKCTEKRKR